MWYNLMAKAMEWGSRIDVDQDVRVPSLARVVPVDLSAARTLKVMDKPVMAETYRTKS
jgi:hypothetical protein